MLRRADLLIGAGLLALVVFAAIIGPWAWPRDPIEGDLLATMLPPLDAAGGKLFPLGSDQLGRDLLARILAGTRLSLGVVLVAAAISVVLGTFLGMVAGYFGGWTDTVIMRLVDVQLAIPFILLILLVVAVIGPGIGNLVVVLGVTGWAIFARVARARVLELRELEYIEATRALALPHGRVLLRHILPGVLAPQLVLLTLDLPRLVILEASVGFLGLGIQPPTPTLGNLIGDGRSYMLLADWLVIWPGVVIAALVIGFNLLGDGLVRATRVRLD
ncbi:MAG: ABC transporter permease [Gammaproteobacteria bacterium]|nr:ABC transporter permease [Gammaproteobacteria bacterium]